MLTAERRGFWKSCYDLTLDGAPVTSWDPSLWTTGGSFTFEGRPYYVRANAWGSKYTMTDGEDAVIATAGRVGRKHWSVEAGGQVFDFERTSSWRNEHHLLHNGIPVGTVRQTGSWTGNIEAELPGLPLPVQIFVLGVMISLRNAQAAAA